jgi:hypothetical protein
MPRDSRDRKPWEVPDCPRCGGHIFVGRSSGPGYDWICYASWCRGGSFNSALSEDDLRDAHPAD